jgi:hypothetical protein
MRPTYEEVRAFDERGWARGRIAAHFGLTAGQLSGIVFRGRLQASPEAAAHERDLHAQRTRETRALRKAGVPPKPRAKKAAPPPEPDRRVRFKPGRILFLSGFRACEF